ncbi:hypothetical protein Pyn_04034 [Prunus yedoensis var. nudiflora]|uniref:Uncharacterized protein n=1 Tax=Prunus yedoensis var. nudiflora TaxID=2094558 RepID=A0A315AEI1_PRUYE|nr:hypothetical protein Pyn_04034 [Prunus yedoensis var. nudiflora]
MGSDSLSVRAAMMSKSLRKSQTNTNSVVSILGSFNKNMEPIVMDYFEFDLAFTFLNRTKYGF